MTKSKQIHVTPRPNGWAVVKDGASRASTVRPTQREAEAVAISLAKKEGAEVVTHGTDGKIRSKDSYGRDPNPPKDREH